ncbi:MAG: hypothetical protein LBT01_07075 [Spirochaetaceae bacterium]|jgi:predicted metalloendopeptidase|nr:hypothetical protein [Spirochaetaceae bacterium]
MISKCPHPSIPLFKLSRNRLLQCAALLILCCACSNTDGKGLSSGLESFRDIGLLSEKGALAKVAVALQLWGTPVFIWTDVTADQKNAERTILYLSQDDISMYAAFNIVPDDPLYLHPQKRASIW